MIQSEQLLCYDLDHKEDLVAYLIPDASPRKTGGQKIPYAPFLKKKLVPLLLVPVVECLMRKHNSFGCLIHVIRFYSQQRLSSSKTEVTFKCSCEWLTFEMD